MNADWELLLRKAIEGAQVDIEASSGSDYSDGFDDGYLWGLERAFVLITGKEYYA